MSSNETWTSDYNVPIDTKVWLYDFDSNNWSTAPADATKDAKLSSKRKHAMTYDSKEQSVVIYGGISKPLTPGGEPPFSKDLWSIKL